MVVSVYQVPPGLFVLATMEATTAVGISGYMWYGDDSPNLTGSGQEQARLVKTVKVQVASAIGEPGSDRRLPPGRGAGLYRIRMVAIE